MTIFTYYYDDFFRGSFKILELIQISNYTDLEGMVGIEARIVISFGLEVNINLNCVINFLVEVIMDSSIVLLASVWCSCAFLRAWWDTSNPNERLNECR